MDAVNGVASASPAPLDELVAALLFQAESVAMIVAFLALFVRAAAKASDNDDDSEDGDNDERAEATRVASEVLFAMNQLANNTYELSILLDALRQHPIFSAPADGPVDAVWTLLSDHELMRDERLAVCFARFVSSTVTPSSSSPNASERNDCDRVLHELVGGDVDEWKQCKWERDWHLVASPTFCRRAFGSPSDCVDMVEAILRGFSIPQVDADAARSLDLAAFLLAVDLDSTLGLRHEVDVSFVRDGVLHPTWTASDVLAVEDIVDAFKNKYTVGIRGVHARSHRIAAVCSALQRELMQHVNANIYWTPPGEQGFALHIDDHCVFVIQLKGKKNWHLKPHVGALPALYSDLSKPLDIGPTRHLILEPGEVLYLPRGTPHCADTRGLDEDSIHLTIGVEVERQFTKRELVMKLIAQLPQDSDHARHLELVQAALESQAGQNLLRQGLMAWHLESDSALHQALDSLLAELVGSVPEDLAAVAVDNRTLASMRARILEERCAFLASREKLADRFVSLHRCLHAPPPATSREKPEDDSFRASKKPRHDAD
ncbi:hypothetical protein PybrP1_007979 [[Pythium] brassicae (nom. inval.)]|nr:hypothetical protein PybrP1_007979 [[Pythium] brassicae (nom. inval.)]